jgi:hypothetical protein
MYTAITVMPAIYHDSPYTSPFSAPTWYISQRIALAVFITVGQVVDFLGKYMSFVYRRKGWTTPSLRKKVLSYRKVLSRDDRSGARRSREG